MIKTIKTNFDPKTLPKWAQKHLAVVALAEKDLAFRCNVFTAKTKQYRNSLIKQAEKLY